MVVISRRTLGTIIRPLRIEMANNFASADAAMAKIDLAKMGADRARILAEWTKRYDGKSAPK